MKSLSREIIQRMIDGNGYGAGGGGMSSAQLASMLSGFAQQSWVEDNFVAIEWFEQIFQVFDDTTKLEVNGELPVDTSKLNIKAMFGFWTDFYISALGNGGQVGASIYLATLRDVNVEGVRDGECLVYDAAHNEWVAGSRSTGTVTQIQTGTGLVGGPITNYGTISIDHTYQSYISHGETAYGWGNHASQGYATQSWVSNQGFATATWVNQNFLPLAGGAMVAGARISSSGGNLIIGNSNNAAWLMLQDVCSQNGSNYWQITAAGNATFANVLSNGYVTALSDERDKDIIGFEELAIETIAGAPIARFIWKDRHDANDHLGSIAQYWQPIVPELVPMVGGKLSMDYAAIALISVISIARKVMNHEERIRELEEKLKK